MHSSDKLFLRSLECYFCIYFPRCSATREINTKITLSWALKQSVTPVHTLFSIYASWIQHLIWLWYFCVRNSNNTVLSNYILALTIYYKRHIMQYGFYRHFYTIAVAIQMVTAKQLWQKCTATSQWMQVEYCWLPGTVLSIRYLHILIYSLLVMLIDVDRYIIPFLYLITHLFSGYVCGYLLVFLRINSPHSGNHMIVQWYMKES